MAGFYPLSPDARKRIEKWVEDHPGETMPADGNPCAAVNEGSRLDPRSLEKLQPRYQTSGERAVR